MPDSGDESDVQFANEGNVSVREAVFGLFRAFEMTTVFGNPESTELPIFRSLPDDFQYVLGLQESIAVGIADGFAQATRNAALVNLHSAAGLGHALGNIFTAFKNQTPLVITAGQQARAILPFEPFLHARRATEFPSPYVKWACEPARATIGFAVCSVLSGLATSFTMLLGARLVMGIMEGACSPSVKPRP